MTFNFSDQRLIRLAIEKLNSNPSTTDEMLTNMMSTTDTIFESFWFFPINDWSDFAVNDWRQTLSNHFSINDWQNSCEKTWTRTSLSTTDRLSVNDWQIDLQIKDSYIGRAWLIIRLGLRHHIKVLRPSLFYYLYKWPYKIELNNKRY